MSDFTILQEPSGQPVVEPQKRSKKTFFVFGAFLTLIIFFAVYLFLLRPPRDFPPEKIISIPAGTSLSSVGNMLEKSGIVRSSRTFQNFVIWFGEERGVESGDYFFKEPRGVWYISKMMSEGRHGFETIRVTIPEGTSLKGMASIFEKQQLPKWDSSDFLFLAKGKEGYLFPDTYFFSRNASVPEIIQKLEENFQKKTGSLKARILASGRAEREIITMASIIEKEADNATDRRLISGIFWRRIRIKMPLQSCATLGYVTGKGSLELTEDELKLDSPYNTYINPNLPPTPISNPGLDSILAALEPKESNYLYFLNDTSGKIHYAATYAEHLANRAKYIQ